MESKLRSLYRKAALGKLIPKDNRWFSWVSWLVEAVHVAVVLVREAMRDRLHVRAAMLAYWTTVAIVPILLLGFSLTGPLGLGTETRDAVRTLLYDTILASSIEDVGSALDDLLLNANLGTLGLVGVGAIMVIGAQLYMNVELAYNDIFRTRVRRSWIARFMMFYAVLTLCPILIAGGFLATAHLGNDTVPPVLGHSVPVLLTAMAFVGALKLLPCTEISWKASLTGGLLSAGVFELAKRGFGLYTELFGTRDSMAHIYGALAFLPVFLLWLYVLWVIVLVGVEVAYIVEYHGSLIAAQRRIAMDPYATRRHPDGHFAVQIMQVVAEHFRVGRGPLSPVDIGQRLGAEPRHVQLALDVLEDANLVVESERNTYVPGRPPDQISISDVHAAWQALAAPLLLEEHTDEVAALTPIQVEGLSDPPAASG